MFPLISVQQQQQINQDQQKKSTYEQSRTHLYACLEQPETLNILKYLNMPQDNNNTLTFDSGMKYQYSSSTVNANVNANANMKNFNNIDPESSKEQKKSKRFQFDKIYSREQKFKYAFSDQINGIIEKLFQGYSQTMFIYGTDEFKKDRILIGESQNAGLLLTTIAGIFQYSHQNQLEDEVTIKISCSMFKDGQFTDPFSSGEFSREINAQIQQNNSSCYSPKNNTTQITNLICSDSVQNKYLLGSPQIIVRNMRTVMKIINLITKRIQQRRQHKQSHTENLIFTVKLQIDKAYDKYSEQVYEYDIPKLYIVKLGNPSVANTLNGVNKNNEWFVNLFNYLQGNAMKEKNSVGKNVQGENGNGNVNNINSNNESNQKSINNELDENLLGFGIEAKKDVIVNSSQSKDPFTNYIKDVVLNGVADIHCFVSIDNKMTSNQCLTAFIFNNYILSYHTKPKKTNLNINQLNLQKKKYQEQLLTLFQVQQSEKLRELEVNEKFKKKYNLESFFKIKGRLVKVSQHSEHRKKHANSIGLGNANTNAKDLHSNNNKNNFKNNINPTSDDTNTPSENLIKQTLRSIIIQNKVHCDNLTSQIKILFLNYIQHSNEFMQILNRLEYEYAMMLSNGCEKLSKYIFNEEIEEFFYAKKISLEYSSEFFEVFEGVKRKKMEILEGEEKIIKKMNLFIKKITLQLQSIKTINTRQQLEQLFRIKKQKILTLIRLKDTFIQLFKLYNTMSYHFIYEDNEKLKQNLLRMKISLENQLEKKYNKQNNKNNYYEQRIKNMQSNNSNQIQQSPQAVKIPLQKQQQMNKNENLPHKQIKKSLLNENKLLRQKLEKLKSKKSQNELDRMFKNSNVGVVRSQFNKSVHLK